ncbi:uncharacterized protein LOC110828075 [Zootermopsis nevadensis]|uniref:uncharacterized protein LOC110828075 n=1 Tax=Zootermopsis nevadensis TaxID=136037 RepID=UPI000B8E9757|nr:uncharacterized protein LOC110828075 [Zootermopsis nevadensis]
MSHSDEKISKTTKSVQSDYETPVDRSRLLGWADKTLSKLKSDKNFLRKTGKKSRQETTTGDEDFCTTPSKKGECEKELEPNEEATFVSEVVTSKLKRKVQHLAFDASVTRCKRCALEVQRAEISASNERPAFDYSDSISDSKKLKKYKMSKDYYTVIESESTSGKMKNAITRKQRELQKSNRTFAIVLEEGNRTNEGDTLERNPKAKKKEKGFYTHPVSKRKKLNKYRECTEKCKPNESRHNSENKDEVGSGDRCESSSERQEEEAFEGYYNSVEKRKKKKHKHDYSFDEMHNLCYGCYKTESASKGRKQKTDKRNSRSDTVEFKKKKKNGNSRSDTYSNSSLDVQEGVKKKTEKKKHKGVSTDKRQSQAEEMESETVKKASSSASKERTDDKIKEIAVNEGDVECESSDRSAESTVTVSNSKETNKIVKLVRLVNTLHTKNIKQSRKKSKFGLSPIYRLLAAESDLNNTGHACQSCRKCKRDPDVRYGKSADNVSTDRISVIKIEPGIKIKQEKEDVDGIGAHITDKPILAVKEELQSELSPDFAGRTDDSVGNVGGLDKSINSLTCKEEQAGVGSDSGESRYSVLKEDALTGGIDNNVNGNEETDAYEAYYNIYDDKFTVNEEILTSTHDYQNYGQWHAEDTESVNLKFGEKQNTDYMGGADQLNSVSTDNFKTVDVQKTTSVKETNGLNVRTASEYGPAAQNNTWNEECADNLRQPSKIRNYSCDVRGSTTGEVNFIHVAPWCSKKIIARILGVRSLDVYVQYNLYGNIRVTVKFDNLKFLKKIQNNASKIQCARWFITRGSKRWAAAHPRSAGVHHRPTNRKFYINIGTNAVV